MFLKTIGQRILFSTVINSMDPATATENAIAAFFQFLSTKAGQDVVEQFIALDTAFIAKLKDLFDKIHSNLTPSK